MKTWMMTMAGFVMVGCSSEPNFPNECEEVADMVKEMGKDAPAGQLEQFEKEMQKARDKWKTLNEQEREKAKQECVTAKDQIKQMKDMLDAMKAN